MARSGTHLSTITRYNRIPDIIRELHGDVTHEILDDSADLVLAEAERRIPVDSGLSREHLVKKVSGNRAHVFVESTPGEGGRDRGAVAIFLEYGTTHTAAQPFLRPAANHTERKIADNAARIVERRLR